MIKYNIFVKSIPVLPSVGEKYDIFISSLGYERRSVYCAETLSILADYKIADAFLHSKVMDYKRNYKWYIENNFHIRELDDDISVKEVDQLVFDGRIEVMNEKNNIVRVGIDISSMSRYKIAFWIEFIFTQFDVDEMHVDYFYSLAPIKGKRKEDSPIKYSGPVTPFFAGWVPNIDIPLTTVIGLGYDPIKSLGICEYLESTNVYAYLPRFEDSSQNELIRHENEEMFMWMRRMSLNGNIYSYDVNTPYATFLNFESLASSLERSVVVPFGPKIFSLLSMLTSLIYYPKISIWRVSSAEHEKPINRYPSGNIVGLTTVLKKQNI